VTAPLGNATPEVRRRVLWIAGVAALALWVFLIYQDEQIKDSGGPGIVPFEVAGTSDRAQEILGEWGEEGQDAARVSLVVDYPYLVAYSIFLAVACTIGSERLSRREYDRLARAGPVIGWGAVVAGALDAIEDAALLRVIDGHTDVFPAIALGAAIGKFALAALALVYAIAGATLGRGPRRAEPAATGGPQ
jgi:hypothetical protein